MTFPVNTLSTTTIANNSTLLAQATHEYLTNQTGVLGLGSGDYIGALSFLHQNTYQKSNFTPTNYFRMGEIPSLLPHKLLHHHLILPLQPPNRLARSRIGNQRRRRRPNSQLIHLFHQLRFHRRLTHRYCFARKRNHSFKQHG